MKYLTNTGKINACGSYWFHLRFRLRSGSGSRTARFGTANFFKSRTGTGPQPEPEPQMEPIRKASMYFSLICKVFHIFISYFGRVSFSLSCNFFTSCQKSKYFLFVSMDIQISQAKHGQVHI